MGRIGDIETKSLSARVPMETYIHFLATASKNKQTISSYLCDVLINVSANRKPQSFENGGVTREQLEYANSQAFKGAEYIVIPTTNTIIAIKTPAHPPFPFTGCFVLSISSPFKYFDIISKKLSIISLD